MCFASTNHKKSGTTKISHLLFEILILEYKKSFYLTSQRHLSAVFISRIAFKHKEEAPCQSSFLPALTYFH